MKHPKWCLKFISPAEIHAVTNAVRAAEQHTDGEIVPMIVRASARVTLLPRLIFVLGCALAAGVYIGLNQMDLVSEPLWYAVGIIVLFFPLAEIAARLAPVQRLFISKDEREYETHARAALEFFTSGLAHTKNHTGVLIFLSLMERKCVVLADEGISSRLPESTWQGIVDKVIAGIRSGRPADGLVHAIEDCGKILSEHFPASGKHENQLPNQLIIKP